MDYYNYLKSISLFAGLFYIVRLFVYQIEAAQKPSPEKKILQAQYNNDLPPGLLLGAVDAVFY
jgi:putative membrane protein